MSPTLQRWRQHFSRQKITRACAGGGGGGGVGVINKFNLQRQNPHFQASSFYTQLLCTDDIEPCW